jgi:hypothetical protein
MGACNCTEEQSLKEYAQTADLSHPIESRQRNFTASPNFEDPGEERGLQHNIDKVSPPFELIE